MRLRKRKMAARPFNLLRDNPVNVVVMDFVMRGIDGLNLMKLIRHRRPRMPILLVSGFLSQKAGDVLVTTSTTGARYLAKPVRPRELVRTVQELLAEKHSLHSPSMEPR